MPITITIHESGQYYVSNYEGTITNEELLPVYVNFYTNNDVRTGLPELIDLSLADFSQVSHVSLAGLAKWGEELHRQRGELAKKTAIYDPRGSSKNESIIYKVWAKGSPEIVRVFMDQAEAVRWLTEQNETQPNAVDA